jgi:hypothetical protein
MAPRWAASPGSSWTKLLGKRAKLEKIKNQSLNDRMMKKAKFESRSFWRPESKFILGGLNSEGKEKKEGRRALSVRSDRKRRRGSKIFGV